MKYQKKFISCLVVVFVFLFLSPFSVAGLSHKTKTIMSAGGGVVGWVGAYLSRRALALEMRKRNPNKGLMNRLRRVQYAAGLLGVGSTLYGLYEGYQWRQCLAAGGYDQYYGWNDACLLPAPKTIQEFEQSQIKAFNDRCSALVGSCSLIDSEKAESILNCNAWPSIKRKLQELSLSKQEENIVLLSVLDREIRDYIASAWRVIGLMDHLSTQSVKVRIMQTKNVLRCAMMWIKRVSEVEKDLKDIIKDVPPQAHEYLTMRGEELKKRISDVWEKFKQRKKEAFKDILVQSSIKVSDQYSMDPAFPELASLIAFIEEPEMKSFEDQVSCVVHHGNPVDQESQTFASFLSQELQNLLSKLNHGHNYDLLMKLAPFFKTHCPAAQDLIFQKLKPKVETYYNQRKFFDLAKASYIIVATGFENSIRPPVKLSSFFEKSLGLAPDAQYLNSMDFVMTEKQAKVFTKISILSSFYRSEGIFQAAIDNENVIAAALCYIQGFGKANEAGYLKLVRCDSSNIKDFHRALFPGRYREWHDFDEKKIEYYQAMLRERQDLFPKEVWAALIARGFSETE